MQLLWHRSLQQELVSSFLAWRRVSVLYMKRLKNVYEKQYNTYLTWNARRLLTRIKSFLVRACRIWNCLADELDFSLVSLISFKSVLFNYYKTSLATSFDCDDPRTFKTVCLKCYSVRLLSRLLYVSYSLFFVFCHS